MLALYRSGSQAEALEHYAVVRRGLVDELGLEPGPALREMQQRILRQDATLDGRRRPVAPDRACASVSARADERPRCVAAAVADARGLGRGGGARAAWRRRRGRVLPRRAEPALVTIDAGDARARAATALPAAAARIDRRAGRALGHGARRRDAAAPRSQRRGDADGPGRARSRRRRHRGGRRLGRGRARRPGRARRRADQPRRAAHRSRREPVRARRRATASCGSPTGASRPSAGSTRAPASVLGTTTLRGHAGGHRGRPSARCGSTSRPSGGSPGWIRAAVGSATRSRSARAPGPIVAGADGVWVANALDSTVSLIDPDRGAVHVHAQVRGTATRDRRAGRQRVGRRRRRSRAHPAGRDEPAQECCALPSAATALATDGGTPAGRAPPERAAATAAARCVYARRRGSTTPTPTAAAPASRVAQRELRRPARHLGAPGLHRDAGAEPGAGGAAPAGRRADLHVPPATGPALLDRAAACALPTSGAAWNSRSAAIRRSPGYLRALPGVRGCPRLGARCDLRAAVEPTTTPAPSRCTSPAPTPSCCGRWRCRTSPRADSTAARSRAPAPTGSRASSPTGSSTCAATRYFRERAPAAQPDGYPDRIVWAIGGTPEHAVADVHRRARRLHRRAAHPPPAR